MMEFRAGSMKQLVSGHQKFKHPVVELSKQSSNVSNESGGSRRSGRKEKQHIRIDSHKISKDGPDIRTDKLNSPKVNSDTQIIPWNSGSSADLGNGATRNDLHGMKLGTNENTLAGGSEINGFDHQNHMMIINSSADVLLPNQEEEKNSMSFLPDIIDRKAQTFKFTNILAGTDPDSMSDGGDSEGAQPSDEAEEYYTGRATSNVKIDKSFSDDDTEQQQ